MLTVIITSYGNRPYLERCIDYWSRSVFSVVVADGSLSPWRGEISSNITYLHLPTPHGANPFSDYARRKLIAIENVKTKYVANCADDDFLAFNGLSRCVNYLESHPEIAATHGWGPWFLHDEFNLRWRFPDFSKKPNEQAISDTADSRMAQILDPFAGIIYGVFRTPVLRDAFELSANLTSELMIELSISLSTVIFGKFDSVPYFYQAREIMPASKSKHRRRVDRYMKETVNQKIIEDWLNALAAYLVKHSPDLSPEQARRQIESVLDNYSNQLNKIGRQNFINNIPGHLKHAIRFFIPRPILRARNATESPSNSYSEYPLLVSSQPHNGDQQAFIEAREDFKLILDSINNFGPLSVTTKH